VTVRRLLAALALVLPLLVAGCGDEQVDPNGTVVREAAIRRDATNAARPPLVIGGKDFTEQTVLAEVYAQALSAAGFRARAAPGIEDEGTAIAALATGKIDLYPEYVATALLSFCAMPVAAIPSDPEAAVVEARRCLADRGMAALPPTPFSSTNAVALTRPTAQRLGVQLISDLSRVDQHLVLYGSPECRRRQDCLLGLRETYGLRFRGFRPVDVDRRHAVLRSDPDAASIVFSTDPQNRREQLVVLEDDRGIFPPNNAALVGRQATIRRAGPALRRVVGLVQEGLVEETVQELNARVDLDGQPAREVAAAYLRESGLVAAPKD
jgi:glycine betaine/choline ABC-type transport system substrate-binding protein